MSVPVLQSRLVVVLRSRLALRNALRNINNEDFSRTATRLKEASHRLAVETEQLARRFEGVEAHYTSQEKKTSKEISYLTFETESLKTTKKSQLESSQKFRSAQIPLGVPIGSFSAVEDSSVRSALHSDYYRARLAVEGRLKQSSVIDSQIHGLEGHIRTLEGKQLRCHKKAEKIKNGILFVKNAFKFWQHFKQASEQNESHVILLERIMQSAP